jgi:outer membrane protein assembly factor BamB
MSSAARSLLFWLLVSSAVARSAPAGAISAELGEARQGPVLDVERQAGILWRFHAGAPLNGGPGVAPNGDVYVGTVDGYVHALSPDGAFRWSYTVSGGILGAPIVEPLSGRVHVATTARRIYALQPRGTLWWRHGSRASIVTPLSLAGEGTLIFGGGDRRIWAVSSRAVSRWRAAVPGPIAAGPTAGSDGHQAVVVSAEGTVSWVRGAWSRWDRALGGAPSGEPLLLEDGRVYAVVNRQLYALGDRGKVAWKRPEVERVVLGPDGRLIVSFDRRLSILGAEGAVERDYALPVRVNADVLAVDSRLFVPGEDGSLVVLGADGVLGRIAVARAALHAPKAARDVIVVAAGDGTVVGIRRGGWGP